MLRFAPLVVACACTLLDDSYEPSLVSDNTTAVSPDVIEPVTRAPEGVDARGCATEGTGGAILNAGEPSCMASIGLLEAQPPSFAPEPAEVDDAGAPAPEAPSVAPPCGEFGAPEPISGLEFAEQAFGPALSPDGRTLYFSAYVAGQQQLYSATRSGRDAAFSNVTELSSISSPDADGAPFLTEDGARIYFYSERPGGVGGRDIWMSGRSGASFDAPELVVGINSPGSDLLPWVSADERTLLFVSTREGGRGAADVWSATRANASEAFANPVNLFELSSNRAEGRIVLSADGLTAYFSSDRGGGQGAHDLWTASRERVDQPFAAPQNLRALNSDGIEQDVMLSSDETELLFATTREGRPSALWRAVRSCSPSGVVNSTSEATEADAPQGAAP